MNLLSPTDLLQLILLIVCAVAFFRAASVENVSGWLWAGISIAVFAFTWLFLRGGLLDNLLGQLGVLIGIAIVRAILAHRESR